MDSAALISGMVGAVIGSLSSHLPVKLVYRLHRFTMFVSVDEKSYVESG